MRRLFLLLPFLIACGVKSTTVEPPNAPDSSGVVATRGRFASCHACAIGPYEALTAAHCVDPRPFDRDVPLLAVRSSYGLLLPGYVWPEVDVATLYSKTEFARFYERSETEPVPSEHLYLVNFDWRSKDKAFAERPIEVTVKRVVAGHVIFDPSGDAGSSGSCVLNAAGKLVAINVAGMGVGFMSKEEVGIAVGVWGEWFYVKPEPEIKVILEEGR